MRGARASASAEALTLSRARTRQSIATPSAGFTLTVILRASKWRTKIESQKNSIEEYYRRHPLSAFSVYTEIQTDALEALKKETITLLDSMKVKENTVNAEVMTKASYFFWFWVLGAFEVIRTMNQHSRCFDQTTRVKIHKIKAQLSQIRNPFAKQAYGNQREPIQHAENSIAGLGSELNSLIYLIKRHRYDARSLMEEVDTFFKSITLENIAQEIPRGEE